MGMVVSAAVTGVPIIEEFERPHNTTKNFRARAIVEPPPEIKSQHFPPPPPTSSSSSVKTVRKTYAATTTTGAARKTSKISNFKGRTPPISTTASSKKLTRKKIQK